MSDVEEGEEVICTCDDPSWLTQVFINGALQDEAILDADITNRERSQRIVDEVKDRQYDLTKVAEAAGQPWCVRMFCPKCQHGTEWNSDGAAKTLGPTKKPTEMIFTVLKPCQECGDDILVTTTEEPPKTCKEHT